MSCSDDCRVGKGGQKSQWVAAGRERRALASSLEEQAALTPSLVQLFPPDPSRPCSSQESSLRAAVTGRAGGRGNRSCVWSEPAVFLATPFSQGPMQHRNWRQYAESEPNTNSPNKHRHCTPCFVLLCAGVLACCLLSSQCHTCVPHSQVTVHHMNQPRSITPCFTYASVQTDLDLGKSSLSLL